MRIYSKKIIGIVIGVALVVGGGVWLWRSGFDPLGKLKAGWLTAGGGLQKLKGLKITGWGIGQGTGNREQGIPSTGAGRAGGAAENKGDFLLYVHPGGAFSFHYPVDFRAETFPNGKNGDVVLISKAGGQALRPDSRQAIQIFVVPFDEEGPITAARIQKDLPAKRVENPQEVLIGAAKDVKALLFSSENPEAGPTREVWFVAGGYLYEVMIHGSTRLTTRPDAEQVMGKMLETFE